MAFAGTPEFARRALAAIVEAGFDVALVLTQPDRPAGRGMKQQASPVKQFADGRGIAVVQPRSLRLDGRFAGDAEAANAALAGAAPDIAVVAAYGLILPPWLLALPRLGCLNIHASLLPRWRGAAPIQRAIEAGDAVSGITIMQMDAGLDTGPMLLSETVAIGPDDTAATLHDRLAAVGAGLIVAALRDVERLRPTPQPAVGATYAPKIEKAEAAIDWSLPAATIERRLRAFDPFPGCSFAIGGVTVKVWRGRVVEGAGAAGTLLGSAAAGPVVACGAGALELVEAQRPGGRRGSAADVLRHLPLAVGTCVGGG